MTYDPKEPNGAYSPVTDASKILVALLWESTRSTPTPPWRAWPLGGASRPNAMELFLVATESNGTYSITKNREITRGSLGGHQLTHKPDKVVVNYPSLVFLLRMVQINVLDKCIARVPYGDEEPHTASAEPATAYGTAR
jgi:hypothetical protein